MKKNRPWIMVLLLIIGAGVLMFLQFNPNSPRKKQAAALATYTTYCSSCHLLPDPTNIPKHLWTKNVLPEMAARMGYGNIRNSGRPYPEKSMIDTLEWRQIEDYIMQMAPDHISNEPIRKGRSEKLIQFVPHLEILNNLQTAGAVVNIHFDVKTNRLFIGDMFGSLYEWNKESTVDKKFNSPPVSTVLKNDILYVAEIGIMGPSEKSEGMLYKIHKNSIDTIIKNLHRPVYTAIDDLNEDGENEIVSCEFGFYTGELSLLIKNEDSYKKKTLLALPGSIKVEVVDMDKDGKKDIVALFSQGKEGIYIFYQKENLGFEMKQVISLGPEYGTSWFELLDYNNDGALDILLANGDNADYSNFLKPYHGVRLFINESKDTYVQKWFYPINGATRVLADDFDQDGDFDFAVLAFFPDFDGCPEEGFVYLENKDSANYGFIPQTTPKAASGNWMVMDKGDFDQDGDTDLMLGNFKFLAAGKLKAEDTYDLLFLENKAVLDN